MPIPAPSRPPSPADAERPPLVLKYGGNAMTDPDLRRAVAAEIRALAQRRDGRRPLVVHGGGPFIQRALDEAGVESRFVRGLRVTDEAALPLVERALTLLGKELAHLIGPAVALTGRDAGLLRATVADPELGRVGRMRAVDPRVLRALLDAALVPVVACLAIGDDDAPLNVNADEVAGAVAGTLNAPLLFLSNVPGLLERRDDPRSLLSEVDRAGIEARIADGRIAGGMIPKVEAALAALTQGARYAVIADGRTPEAVRAALAGGAGTRVVERTARG